MSTTIKLALWSWTVFSVFFCLHTHPCRAQNNNLLPTPMIHSVFLTLDMSDKNKDLLGQAFVPLVQTHSSSESAQYHFTQWDLQ